MRLFHALFRKKMPPGNIYRGKRRLVEPVTMADIQNLKNQFAIEEKNMFYLRHAYLTPEQSEGHAKALGKRELFIASKRAQVKDFKKHVTLESVLGHLKYQEAWE